MQERNIRRRLGKKVEMYLIAPTIIHTYIHAHMTQVIRKAPGYIAHGLKKHSWISTVKTSATNMVIMIHCPPKMHSHTAHTYFTLTQGLCLAHAGKNRRISCEHCVYVRTCKGSTCSYSYTPKKSHL